ncbi:uncharacterized protein LOC106866685 [Brachypodium distachyon]|uniref:KIB1-4 beta-propeller domain-containing protein n=1 Tax=Brachypodium distachyon TaxID=15368 RepID=A0A2K2CMV2_BRADI|nr:uncharacterized protein LOC106866685 [Brachypodium distachyon]PNT63368.1 hypothetical protein BRADI_4g14771v3 [Brachypodium distachyon]|eukprot:XP_014757800.1 uncharacterized protein LOC106866685 [Brachypodium distachyon]
MLPESPPTPVEPGPIGRDCWRIVLKFMEALEIPDLVRSDAVWASWHTAYLAFRRRPLPLPISRKQLPCLLYACQDYAPDAAALCCSFTGDSVRVPLPLPPLTRHSTIGSVHGWLVTADEASNLRLLNPITGAQAALPPITAMHNVESSVDADGHLIYNVFERGDSEPTPFHAHEARDCMYHRVTLSCSPSAGSACIALLVRMSMGELSYARLGDEQWTWISPDDHQCMGGISWGFMDSFYNEEEGLFYVLRGHRSVFTLNLNGPSPVLKKIMRREKKRRMDPSSMYITQAPWGDILQIWRWRDYIESSTPVEVPEDPDGLYENDIHRFLELRTTEIEIYKVDLDKQKLVKMTNLAHHALFLGYNGTMCLPIKDFPMLKSNCVYMTDDSFEYVSLKYNWREIGVWDMESKSLQSFDNSMFSHAWLNWPSPVWITPSLF